MIFDDHDLFEAPNRKNSRLLKSDLPQRWRGKTSKCVETNYLGTLKVLKRSMQRTGTKVLPWELQNPDFGGDDLCNLINPIPSLKVPPRCGHTGGTRIIVSQQRFLWPQWCCSSNSAHRKLLPTKIYQKNRPQFVERQWSFLDETSVFQHVAKEKRHISEFSSWGL